LEGVSDVYHASRRLFRWGGCVAAATLVLLYHFIPAFGKAAASIQLRIVACLVLARCSDAALAANQTASGAGRGDVEALPDAFSGGTTQLLAGIGIITVLLLGGQLVEMAMVVFAASLLQYAGASTSWRGRRATAFHRAIAWRPGWSEKFFQSGDTDGNFESQQLFVLIDSSAPPGVLVGAGGGSRFFSRSTNWPAVKSGGNCNWFRRKCRFSPGNWQKADRAAAGNRMQRDDLPRYNPGIPGERGILWGSPLLVELWVGQDRYIGSSVLLVIAVDYFLMSSTVVWALFVFAAGSKSICLVHLAFGPF